MFRIRHIDKLTYTLFSFEESLDPLHEKVSLPLTVFRMRDKKAPPISFSPLTSTKKGPSPPELSDF